MSYFKLGNSQFHESVKSMSKEEFFEAFKASKLNLDNTWKALEAMKPKKAKRRQTKKDED
jgi:hypothetical protein